LSTSHFYGKNKTKQNWALSLYISLRLPRSLIDQAKRERERERDLDWDVDGGIVVGDHIGRMEWLFFHQALKNCHYYSLPFSHHPKVFIFIFFIS
jgi:hypothetical protein